MNEVINKDCLNISNVIPNVEISSLKSDYLNKLIKTVTSDSNYSLTLDLTDLEASYTTIKINNNLFTNKILDKLTKIKFPKNLKILTLDPNCFDGCTNLKSVEFPSTTIKLELGSNCFGNCKNLESITLNASSTLTLGPNCFDGCTNLKSVILSSDRFQPNIILGLNCFINCNNLYSVKYPSYFKRINNINEYGLNEKVRLIPISPAPSESCCCIPKSCCIIS
jgi:hypothetical protein